MYKIQNYFKAFALLVLITVPNFAKNTFVFKTTFDPSKADASYSENTIDFISKKNLYSHIANVESKGKYNVVNKNLMIGKYQASKNSLREFGYSQEYIDSIYQTVYTVGISKNRTRYYFNAALFPPSEQERFIRWYTKRMERVFLKYQIQKYVGKTVGGVYITKAGILHASMLGHTHVKEFLRSDGKINYTPRRGYSIKERLQQLEKVELY